MKHCPYCSTDYALTENKCPSCQATDAETKCDSCGTIHKANFCPNCGFGANDTLGQCPKCGSKTKERFCPRCGYDFSGRVDADAQNKTTTVVHVSAEAEQARIAAEQKAAKKKKTWTIVLLVIFPPAGILLTWLLMKDWSKKTKIIVSAVSAVWMIVALVSAPKDSPDARSGAVNPSSTAAAAEEMSATEAPNTTTVPVKDSTADWKQFLKDYEAWVDSYNIIIKKCNAGDLTVWADYLIMMEKMDEWDEDADAWEEDLSDAEWIKFYAEYMRITSKMLDGLDQ